ncbi:MAG: hypothetical protein ACK45W_15815 [Pseudanabaena sp.]
MIIFLILVFIGCAVIPIPPLTNKIHLFITAIIIQRSPKSSVSNRDRISSNPNKTDNRVGTKQSAIAIA